MLYEHEFFSSWNPGPEEGGAISACAPLPPQAMEVHSTLRPIQVVGKQNSSIQFLPGQPHFLAHSSSFILRDWVHLSVLLQLCEDVSCLLHGNWK